MSHLWRKFWALNRDDRHMLAQAFVLLPLIKVGLHCLGLRRCQIALAALTPPPLLAGATNPVRLMAAADYVVAVAARRGLSRANCLQRSLIVWWLLRSAGLASELRIGVRKEPGKLEAHAWIERDGRVINDYADIAARFTPFDAAIGAQEVTTR